MALFTMIYTTFIFWLTLVAAQGPLQRPAVHPVPGRATSQGCFGSLSASASGERMKYPASGVCWQRCRQEGKAVMLLHMVNCYCADTYPPRLSILEDEKCDYECFGYGFEACGSAQAYSVFNTGLRMAVESDPDAVDEPEPASSSASASTTFANIGQPTPTSCTPVLTYVEHFADEVSTAVAKFAKMIQDFFNKCIGRPGSNPTKLSSGGTEVMQEAMDL
ncbi:hypothetical protein AUP68_08171 [Ilyonectria robusta]